MDNLSSNPIQQDMNTLHALIENKSTIQNRNKSVIEPSQVDFEERSKSQSMDELNESSIHESKDIEESQYDDSGYDQSLSKIKALSKTKINPHF